MIFNNIFDHIYVLNLKESVERRNHIENEFKRVGIEKYEFFEAVHYDSDEAKDLIKSDKVKKFPTCFRCLKIRCNCENNYLTPFQIANWCSFLNIFKDILKNNYKFVLICEDDIVFTFQYKRIINKLLSPNNFRNYKINMNRPLLIKMGSAYNPDNHNSKSEAHFLKNLALSNPCFAINNKMADIYLKNLKLIDHTSDIYFHRKIPRVFHDVQNFTMFPYPVYELSFVKSKQKFESLIRPKNGIRRLEFSNYLFLSSNILINFFYKNIIKKLKIDIRTDRIGFHGNIDTYILLNENDKNRFYFQNKILLYDDYNDDIKIIYFNIKNNKKEIINIYNLYLNKINNYFNLHIVLNNDEKLLKNIIEYYDNYLKLINLEENLIKININNESDSLISYIKIMNLKDNIDYYNTNKKIILDNCNLLNSDIGKLNEIYI